MQLQPKKYNAITTKKLTFCCVHVRYDALIPLPLRSAPPTAYLPPVLHFPPLPPTPSPPPLPPGIAPVSL